MPGPDRRDPQAQRLQQFWMEQNKPFCTWFLLKTPEDRLQVLKKAMPDMPEKGPSAGAKLQPSDVLLPELTQAGMTAGDGKLFVLFMTRRVVENAFLNDIARLKQLHAKKALPMFSNAKLDHLGIAFVDPNDPEEKVLGLPKDASSEAMESVRAKIADNGYVEANVWVARKLRQTGILNFLVAVVDAFEADVKSGQWP